jgi:hypothetical protein
VEAPKVSFTVGSHLIQCVGESEDRFGLSGRKVKCRQRLELGLIAANRGARPGIVLAETGLNR